MKFISFLFFLFISGAAAQEFTQVPLKHKILYPYNDGPYKFEVKYVSPTKAPLYDSTIYEEQWGYFDETDGDKLKRTSYFLWKYEDPRELAFFTSIHQLRTNPGFHYLVTDPTPEQKGTFYIAEDLFRTGTLIVYCEGVKQSSYKDSVYVVVSIFSPNDDYDDPFNFNFYQKVVKNTTFKVSTGKTTTMTYFKIDMYQEGVFVKTVYDWDSSKPTTPPVALIARRAPGRLSHRAQTFDILGRSVVRSGYRFLGH